MRFDTLEAWLDWQAGLNPRTIELGLERVREVWNRLGNPTPGRTVITIAGTNGKGSSVAFAEAILLAAGYRVGCYTSPHLQHYNERVRLDGRDIDDRSLCEAFDRIDRARGDIPLTYFEFGTLAALLLFADAQPDAVVLEVGLGGRLDAVNLIDADVALITAIGLDHQDWLGDDLDAIGAEKAGIMRAGRPAVFAGREMPASIERHATRIGTPLRVAGRDYTAVRRRDDWDLLGAGRARRALPQPGMRGRVQIDNAAGVLIALDGVAERLPVDQAAIRAGLLNARVAGRFEVRPGRPTWILDVAHNPQAAATLNDLLGDFFCRGTMTAVCGMLQDKDAAGVGAALRDRFDAWHFVDLGDQPRGLSASGLAGRMAGALGAVPMHVGTGVGDVLSNLAATAGADDVVVVFGSFLTVGAAMAWLDSSASAGGDV